MQNRLSVETARAIILDTVRPRPAERVPLDHALGYTLTEDIISRDDIPPFANSAMDGYAVRTEDLTGAAVFLSVVDDIPAGSLPRRPIGPGTAARIMTGAPIPEGADAIVPVEWTESAGEGTVRVLRALAPGMHVRPVGQDVRRGQRVMQAGEIITPPAVGMLAALGVASVSVNTPPHVAVIATGDELVDASEPLTAGKIRNANGPALCAQVVAAGGIPMRPLLAQDRVDDIERVLDEARSADLIVFSGGVSVGAYDFVKQVLDRAGMQFLFWRVKQRPGGPLAFGVLGDRAVFGLPGNPVSSAICFTQYVQPAIARMLGRRRTIRPTVTAVLAEDTPKAEGLHVFARGVASWDETGRLTVRDTGPQASNLYSSVLSANCIVHLPEAWTEAKAGASVQIEWLDWSGISYSPTS